MDVLGRPAYDALVGMLYDGVLDDAAWEHALTGFNHWVGGIGYHSVTWDRANHRALRDSTSLDAPAEIMREFIEKLAPTDPRVPLLLRSPVSAPLRCHEHLSERYVAHSELFNDFLIPNGVRYTYGFHMDGTPGTSELLGIFRAPSEHPFEQSDDAPELALITQHLGRAAKLRANTRGWQLQASLGVSVLDLLELAIVVLDADGHARYLNAAAHQMLQHTRALRVQGGKLKAHAPADEQALHKLLKLASGAMPVAGSHRLMADAQRQWVITALPLRASHAAAAPWQRPMVMLTIGELDRRVAISPYTLKVLFSLSPAEARLALALAEGKELAQYAQEAGVAINTARTQLRHVFDKTGCRRQGDLLRLLHAIPAVHMQASA